MATTIALIALLTSLVSTGISFYTFRLQRLHYLKLAEPIIHVGQWDYENRIFVTLVNLGPGIAIVKKVSVVNKSEKAEN
ncbi:hypothetical protein BH11BAC3_BH11BAC3_12190 [soil metagenome]